MDSDDDLMKCGFLFMIEYHNNFSLEPLFYINDEGLVCQEEFRDVPCYEGMYQVSDLGRVKSLSRDVFGGKVFYKIKDRILIQKITTTGYFIVSIYNNAIPKKRKVHKLVAMAFLGHIPDGTTKIVVDHIDNNPLNNCLSNLQLISQRENTSKDKKQKSGNNYIYIEKNKIRVRIPYNGKHTCLGYFETIELAKETLNIVLHKISINESIEDYIKKNTNLYYKNVYKDGKKYRGRIVLNKKRISLPLFDTPEEAYACVIQFKIENNIKL